MIMRHPSGSTNRNREEVMRRWLASDDVQRGRWRADHRIRSLFVTPVLGALAVLFLWVGVSEGIDAGWAMTATIDAGRAVGPLWAHLLVTSLIGAASLFSCITMALSGSRTRPPSPEEVARLESSI